MGYGDLSSIFQFSSRSVPEKPSNPPRNNPLVTLSSTIEIIYDPILKNGGSNILNYNVYIDDGLYGSYGAANNNGLITIFNSASYGLSLVAGRTYRFKYSGVNVEGESELSDEVAVLMAQVPSSP